MSPWRPVELLGRGGAAEVWRAVDATGRVVALKRLRSELRARPEAVDVLRKEHDWLRAVEGEPFVRTLGLVVQQGDATLVLEHLPGGDLVSLVGADACHWLPALRSVASALGALHDRGAAHGDLKSRNVLFAVDGGARVIDLSSVGPLDAPVAAGTAAYRPAGERITGLEADAFALAALTFELVTGRLPYARAGQTCVGQDPGSFEPAGTAARRLATVARRELMAGGARGLSPLLDVIESVRVG